MKKERKDEELPLEKITEFKVDSSMKTKINKKISSELLNTIIDMKNSTVLNSFVDSYHPSNIAEALEELSEEKLLFFFKTVDSDDSAEIFTLLSQEKKEEVVSAFSNEDLQRIVIEMQLDNLVDFVDVLPSNLVSKVLKATNKDNRNEISKYLNFKEDSAGTIMTSEYLEIEEDKTIKECIKKIREVGKEKETIWKIFAVDRTRVLVGTVTLDVLLENDEYKLIKDVMNKEIVSVYTNTDEEDVLRIFRKYDISILPVINSQGRILGIITFDDVIDVASEENTEDIQLQAHIIPTNKPYLKVSCLSLFKSYAIWIALMLFLDTFISIALSYLQTPLLMIPILLTILPSIMGTSGNSADQTATVTIRELAINDLSGKKYRKFFIKELKASVLTGLIISSVAFLWIFMEIKTGIIGDKNLDMKTVLYICLSASLTFFFCIVLGKTIGTLIPKLAKKIHIDPAMITSPVVSTMIDIISICAFVLISHFILKIPLF